MANARWRAGGFTLAEVQAEGVTPALLIPALCKAFWPWVGVFGNGKTSLEHFARVLDKPFPSANLHETCWFSESAESRPARRAFRPCLRIGSLPYAAAFFLDAAFFFGIFAPDFRASLSAMATACLRFFTLPPFPPLPDFNSPCLYSCITFLTLPRPLDPPLADFFAGMN